MTTMLLSDVRHPLAPQWVQAIALEHYGLIATVEPLPGERDSNYRVRIDLTGELLVLKVSHPAETPLIADFQTQALLHIARTAPESIVPRVIPTVHGEASVLCDAEAGKKRVVRVFTYLAGKPLPSVSRSAAQRVHLAQKLAQIDSALSTFRHPACSLELPWDLQRADSVRNLLVHVKDPIRRDMANQVLDYFVLNTKSSMSQLRMQPIHNDLNSHNVLVDEDDHERISGILDFGDMVYAPLINELAVACAYQLRESFEDPAINPLTEIIPFVAAYHAALPLTKAEIEILFSLILTRLTMIVAISGWRAELEPDNAVYLLRNNELSWIRLTACTRLSYAEGTAIVRRACGFN